MVDPRFVFLPPLLAGIVDELSGGADADAAWGKALDLLDTVQEDDADLRAAVFGKDLEALRAILAEWGAGKRTLTAHDRGLLKRALKAFRKRLKLTRLDSESTVGGGPTSSGRHSSIVGIHPPDQYVDEVWDELVRQNRLHDAGGGMYMLPD